MEKVRFWKEKKSADQKEQGTCCAGRRTYHSGSGSKPLILPIPGMDSEGVLTSDELFAMKECAGESYHYRWRSYQCGIRNGLRRTWM